MIFAETYFPFVGFSILIFLAGYSLYSVKASEYTTLTPLSGSLLSKSLTYQIHCLYTCLSHVCLSYERIVAHRSFVAKL